MTIAEYLDVAWDAYAVIFGDPAALADIDTLIASLEVGP